LKNRTLYHFGDLSLTEAKTPNELPPLPRYMKGTLSLDHLQDARGLILPAGVEQVWLDDLQDARGLILPAGVTYVSLHGLKSAEGLILPAGVEWVWLDGLQDARGLILPAGVKRVSLNGLQTVRGLKLPEGIREIKIRGKFFDMPQSLQKIQKKIDWGALDVGWTSFLLNLF
jgi:hypothetical protein